MFLIIVLIDAIVRNGGTAAPEANHVPPPPGWRDEDVRNSETCYTTSDEKKTYTEEQRQGVLRCTNSLEVIVLVFHTVKHSNRPTLCHSSFLSIYLWLSTPGSDYRSYKVFAGFRIRLHDLHGIVYRYSSHFCGYFKT